MAATFKIVLHSQPNSDGTYTVALRVTFKRKNRYFNLNRRCKKSQWEESACRFNRTYPDFREENEVLRTYEHRAAVALRSRENEDQPFSWEQFQNAVFPDTRVTHTKDVVGYLQGIADELERVGQHGNSVFYKNTAATLQAYKPKVTLLDINADWLHRWETWMRTKRALTNGGMSILFRTLRAACNRAIKKDKLMPRTWYPFAEFSLAHLTAAKINKAITLAEIRKIEAATLTDPPEQLARDLFMFSFYCRGMNLADIADLRKDQVSNGRILYARKKTHREYSVALTDKARVILERYAGQSPGVYAFPIYREGVHETDQQKYDRKYKVAKQVNAALRRVAESVGVSTKDLTFYTARHTYANALDRSGADRRKIQAALGHSKFSTTEGYLNSFSDAEVDELDKMLE